MRGGDASLQPMRTVLAILTLCLGGCRNDAPTAPSGEQVNQLDDAEAMLNDLAVNEERQEANASSSSRSTP